MVKRNFVEANTNTSSTSSSVSSSKNHHSSSLPPIIIENSSQFISLLEDRNDLPTNLLKISNLLATSSPSSPPFFLNYLLSHPTIPHIIRIFPSVLRSSDIPFMTSLLILLSNSIRSLLIHQQKEGHDLIRLILSEHMKIIYRSLATTSNLAQMAAFSLLEELVGDRTIITSEFCATFDFGHKTITSFKNLNRKPSGIPSPLLSLQTFVVKLFQSCSEDEMSSFSHNHPYLLHSLLKDLHLEGPMMVEKILTTIKNSIIDLNNRSITISFFKGASQPLVEISKLVLCFDCNDKIDEILSRKRTLASNFLLNACTINDNGTISYPLASSGTDTYTLKNRLILDIFLTLSQETKGPSLLLNVKNLLIGPDILQETFLPLLEGSPDVAYHLLLIGTPKQKSGSSFWLPEDSDHLELSSSFAIKLFSYLPIPLLNGNSTCKVYDSHDSDSHDNSLLLSIIPVGGVCGLLSRGSLTRGILSTCTKNILPSLFLLMSLLKRLEGVSKFNSIILTKIVSSIPDLKSSYNCWKKMKVLEGENGGGDDDHHLKEELMMKETLVMGIMSSYLKMNLQSPNESIDFLKMDDILAVQNYYCDDDPQVFEALLDSKVGLLIELGSPRIIMEMINCSNLSNLYNVSLKNRVIDLITMILLPLLETCCKEIDKLKIFIFKIVENISIKSLFEAILIPIFQEKKIFNSSNFLLEEMNKSYSEIKWNSLWDESMMSLEEKEGEGDSSAIDIMDTDLISVKHSSFLLIKVEELVWDDGPISLLNSIIPLLPKKNEMISCFMKCIHSWKVEDDYLEQEHMTPTELHRLLFLECNLGIWLSLIGKAFELEEIDPSNPLDIRGFIDSLMIGFPLYSLCLEGSSSSSSILKSHFILRKLENLVLGGSSRKDDSFSSESEDSSSDSESFDSSFKNRRRQLRPQRQERPVLRERKQVIMILRAMSQQLEPSNSLESRLTIIGATIYMASMAEVLHPGHVAYRAINEIFLSKQIPLPIDFANRIMLDVSDGGNWRGTLGWFLGLIDSIDPFLMDDDWSLWVTSSKKTLPLEDYLVGILMSTNHDNGCRRVAKSILEKITKRKTNFIKMDGGWGALTKIYMPKGMVKEV